MSDYERLGRAFAALHEQGVATFLGLHGSTGVIEDSVNDYKRAAAKMGATDWVGAHVGAWDHNGAHWDHADVLRYRHDNSPVGSVWFSFNHHRPELASILVDALTTEGLDASYEGGYAAVELRLGGAR